MIFGQLQLYARDPCLFKNLFHIREKILQSCSGSVEAAKKLVENWFKEKGVVEAYEFFRPNGPKEF